MRSSIYFAIALVLGIGPLTAQEKTGAAKPGVGKTGLRLSVVGVGAKDYAESLNFYTKVMGFRAAFSFSPNGKTNNTYLQVSRDSFWSCKRRRQPALPA